MTASRTKRRLLFVICCFGLALFVTLGAWQVERRIWKLGLIARVEARVHAAPVAAPPPAAWSSLQSAAAEYRRVKAIGVLRHDKETLVDALTERGAGYWVVTPLVNGGVTILVNRGFVPKDKADQQTRSVGQVGGPVAVTGLLRLTEPEGRFLRRNRPHQERWYSRDVAAIAKARGLCPVAPFFIDADATANPGGLPTGGLTVVRFRNTHLIYALTWFSLAALSLAGLVILRRDARVRRPPRFPESG